MSTRIGASLSTLDRVETDGEVRLGDRLLAAARQGAIYAVVKAAVDRGGAIAFERSMRPIAWCLVKV
jgi:uncharacterized protein DUF4235